MEKNRAARRDLETATVWQKPLFDVEDLSHLESPEAANKVEDDSDGHESSHFKQACGNASSCKSGVLAQ